MQPIHWLLKLLAGCKRALLRQDPHCWYCGRPVCRSCGTLDHLRPVSRGGKHVPDNLVLACERCNQAKSDRLLSEVSVYAKHGRGVVPSFDPIGYIRKEETMLVLTRTPGEQIFIDGGITLTLLRVKGQQVRIGIDAPRETRIERDDVGPHRDLPRPTIDAWTPASTSPRDPDSRRPGQAGLAGHVRRVREEVRRT